MRVDPNTSLASGGVAGTQARLQEIDALRTRDQRQLIGVSRTEVNGHKGSLVLRYKYVLADGTEQTFNENEGRPSPEQLAQEEAEVAELKAAGRREVVGVNDTEYDGHVMRMHNASLNPAPKRLNWRLFKYILIEFTSLLGPLQELMGIAMNSPHLVKRKHAPLRYITASDAEELKRLSRDFYQKLNNVQPEMASIRNKIGAHREMVDLQSVSSLWRRIEPALFVGVINAVIPVVKRLGELNIYEWGRSFGDGSLSMFGARITHPWEEAFEPDSDNK